MTTTGTFCLTLGSLPAPLSFFLHSFPLHAHDKALLIATVLAAVALALVNEAVFIIPTRVDEILPYRPLEEPFAAFTTVHPIVLS